MNDSGIVSDFNGGDEKKNKNGAKRFILVANHLPVKASRDEKVQAK